MMQKYRVKISNFVFGVPPTFIVDNYNPEQFEIIGIANNARWLGSFECITYISGVPVYNRVLIKLK